MIISTIFTTGVLRKGKFFLLNRDYQRFLQTLYYYQFSGPKPRFSNRERFKNNQFNKNSKIVEIICYCLMPNHFHFMLKQLVDNGVQEFMGKVANSYTKYFNTKHRRVGPLLQGEFKSVFVESEEQLIHLSRYIYLNPYAAGVTKDWENFPCSSFRELRGIGNPLICKGEEILKYFKDIDDYKSFISNQASYALEIARIKHLLVDEED